MANPYQIRYDVLSMAKDMMDKQYEMQSQLAWKMMEMAKDNQSEALEAWKTYVPKAITPEEIKAQAQISYTSLSQTRRKPNEF